MSRLPVESRRTRGNAGLVAALIALGILVLTPATARALTVDVVWPASVTVGQTGVVGHVTLTNTLDTAASVCNDGECSSEGTILIPSCASALATPACGGPDTGVFSVASPATIPLGSQCGASPLVTSFDVSVADATQGKLRLTPSGGQRLVLGPAGTTSAACDIPLTSTVVKLPATDAAPDTGVQTLQGASAAVSAQGATGQPVVQFGVGRDVTTVNPAPGTNPPPGPPPPSPGVPPPPPAPVDLDHFKCYEALQPNFRQRTVGTRDQFGQRRTRVLRTRQLCNPVSKNEGKILQPRAHLVCYETRDLNTRFVRRTVLVSNQFGKRKLTVTRPNRLCVPSLKRRTAGAVPSTPNPTRLLDHFRCYDVTSQPATRTVTLRDQFRTVKTTVLRVIRLCNPVRKNNEPVRRAKSHLVCYSIKEQMFNPIGVRVRNQFGRAALRVRRPETLCLPSFKEVIQTTAASAAPPGLDHFKCYEAEQPQLPVRFVGLRDQFGQSEGQVIATRQLCNPVRKNNGKIINSRAHLVCYESPQIGTVPFQPREVRVSNQFGIRQLSVVRPVTLCVPSLKRKGAGVAPTGPNPTLVLDHFRCYDVKPQPVSKTVKLVDQFKSSRTKVVRVVRLCNPVQKNNEPVRRPQAHLVCYEISEAPFQPLAVTVRNQFGIAGLRVLKPQMLCLPSLKKVVAADGSVIANPT